MGLIQNKVTVSQPNSHVVVKNAGGLRGLTGETGPQGPQGVPGEAATVTAGTTTTLPAGSDATVQNVGSTSAAIFNFGIPKGDKGDTGESGAAATISVGTTTTLEPGEDATVTNSGTSSAAVFDFGIPKGAKGDTGSQGPAGQDGADGFSPTATVTKTGDTATIIITDKDGTTTAQISDGVTPTIDPALSPTSENPVQNKVVTNALAGKADNPIVVSSLPATGTAGQEYFVDDRYNTVTELKGDTEQTTYSGKNLLLPSPKSSASSGLTASYDAITGVITLSGTANNNWSNAFNDMTVNLPAGTYTFSATTESGLGRNLIMFNNGTNIGQVTLNSTTQSVQITVTQAVTSIRLWLTPTNGVNYTGKTFRAMVELGSQATSFEPYVGGTASPNPDYPQEVEVVTGEQTITIDDGGEQSQSYTVNLGKNLFDKDNYSVLSGYFNGTTNIATPGYTRNRIVYIPCTPNTTYSVTFPTNDEVYLYTKSVATTAETPANSVAISGRVNTEGTSNKIENFTTDSSAKYLCLYLQGDPNVDMDTYIADIVAKIQIEKGSTATSFAPYFTPIELCKIGTYQDYVYKSGEDWYVHKETNKYTIPDTDVTQGADYTNVYFAAFPKQSDDLAYGAYPNTQGQIYSAAKFQAYSSSWNRDIYIGKYVSSATSNKYWVGLPAGTPLATAQAKLNGSILYYALATPTDTQITDATLITQLEALAGAKIMVDGGTATITSQYLPATLTTAYNSNSGYIDYIYDGTNFVKVR